MFFIIYFDNAATTIWKPPAVIEAVVHAMQGVGNAGRGFNDAHISADRILHQARTTIGSLFNAKNPRQIAFTKNATEALNIIIKGFLQAGDHVVTTYMEHNSVLRPLYLLQKNFGLEISFCPLNPKGVIEISQLENLIKSNTKAIIINHASNVTGEVNDLQKISTICLKHNIHLIVDASQTAGLLPIDVQALNISALAFTGHKSLLGPQGTGGIYTTIPLKPFIVGGTGVKTFSPEQPDIMPTLLEAGTQNVHGLAGLIAGIDYIKTQGLATIRNRSLDLAKLFYEGIKDIPRIKIYGNVDCSEVEFYSRLPIISLNIGKISSGILSQFLADKYEIYTRSGGHCAPLLHKSFGTVEQGMVRFSFSHQNTEEEVKIAIQAIREFVEEQGR